MPCKPFILFIEESAVRKIALFTVILAVFCAAAAYGQGWEQPTGVPKALTDTPSNQETINGLSLPRVLCQSSVPQLIYNGSGWTLAPTGNTQVASCTVPGGGMGLSGSLRITSLWSCTNSSNAKYMNIAFGGNYFKSASLGAYASYFSEDIISNRGSASSQITTSVASAYVFGPTTTTVQTYAVNTANAVTISFAPATSLETAGSGYVAPSAGSANGTNCTLTTATNNFAVGDYVNISGTSWTGGSSSCANVTTTPLLTGTNSTTAVYACPCANSTFWSSGGEVARYSRVQLESYAVELIPGAN